MKTVPMDQVEKMIENTHRITTMRAMTAILFSSGLNLDEAIADLKATADARKLMDAEIKSPSGAI
jgi:hypothetical protein